ncbi:unnamed protein product [marine sediment metagenome]|uniref:Uncharacterized protein n=1 Tax=marine sediment metagenome TaxID=412755 RepID=X1GGH5_9ZZZZ
MNRKEYRKAKKELKERWEYQIKDERNKAIIEAIIFTSFSIILTLIIVWIVG